MPFRAMKPARSRFVTGLAALCLLAGASGASAHEHAAHEYAAQELPEHELPEDAYTVWLCPMHQDNQSHDEANCPICGMRMVQRTLVTRYVCLGEDDGVVEEAPGVCPATGEPLVPTTREVLWICEDAPGEHQEPGVCEDGARRTLMTRAAAHGDHNPRHGGVLFMAPDGVHHLEGAIQDGRFRLYFYDAFTESVSPEPFAARVRRSDDNGNPVGDDLALVATPTHFEASLEGTDVREGERSAFTAFVEFPEREAPDRFDFIFLSEAELAALAGEDLTPAARTLPSALPELVIPQTGDEILAAIHDRDRRVRALIQAGRWADLFIPALEAKDLALAYSERGGDRPWVALKRIVQGAWLLDMYGDLGDRTRVAEAYEVFAEGVDGLPEASGGPGGGPE